MLNWYLQTGKESDVIISSKISLARNLEQFNFYIKSTEEIKLEEKILNENLIKIGYGLKFIKLRDLDEITINSLIEKDLITPQMASKKNITSILINEEENICILVNEEDHLKIQVFTSGLDLEGISNLAIEIDEKLQNEFNIAQSKKYGFLTTSPMNVGTGMKLTVILHLPALSKTGNISKILKFVDKFGIEIKKDNIQDFYVISNKQTLGITEEDIIRNLKIIAEKIIEQERLARKILAENQISLEDEVCRSYGILSNCRKISEKEAEDLLSYVKLGKDLGIITQLTDAKIKKLYLFVKLANLEKYYGQELEKLQEEQKRAEIIKEIIKSD